MAAEPDSTDIGRFPVDVSDYQYKGALQHLNNTWVVLFHCRPLNRDVIVKVKPIPDFLEDIQRYWDKVNPMLQLKQPNLLTPVHAFLANGGSDLWLVYERHSGGPLKEILSTHFPHGIDDQSIVARILLDVLDGLEYMHSHNLMHRNLRASNLHVDREAGTILLTEFGDLKEVDPESESNRRDNIHSIVGQAVPYWLAPEIIMGDAIEPRLVAKSDIYSFGITALEIILGEPPSNYFKHTKAGLQLSVPSFQSYERECPFGKSVQDLVESCLNPNAAERPSIKELKKRASKFWSRACPRERIATRLGSLSRTTEQRINHNLYPPRSITQIDLTGDQSIMTPLARSGEHTLTFGDVDSDKLRELVEQEDRDSDSNKLRLERADSDWDFSSGRIPRGDMEEIKRSDADDADGSNDELGQKQESAGRFLIEQSAATRDSDATNNSGRDSTRILVEGVDDGRRSLSEPGSRLQRANSDYSESDAMSPSVHGGHVSDASPNGDERQVGRFFVSREKTRLSESQSAMSGSEMTRPLDNEPSLSASSVDTMDEGRTFEITDHEANLEAVAITEGIRPSNRSRPPAEEVSDVSDDESGRIKSQVVGRFQVDDMDDDMKKGHSPSVSEITPSPTTDPMPPPGELPPHPEGSETAQTSADILSRLPQHNDEFYMRFPTWTEEDTATFISSIGKAYASIVENISEHAIDGEMFRDLTDDDLQVMGVEKPLFRKKVITMRDRLLKYLQVRQQELNGRTRNGSVPQDS